MSFTDEQLLNLVNNTILTKSDHNIDLFTGGGVQTTSTHNHKIIKHKIYLTFGYDDKRNSISYSEDIDEETSFIWHKAIQMKVKAMQTLNNGSVFSELNKMMNTDSKIEDRDNKIEIEDRDKECNDVVTSSLRKSKPSLKSQIEIQLTSYSNINVEAFNEWIDYKKYKNIAPITKLLNMLTKHDYYTQQEMVDNSIMNNWQGLFELKQQAHTKKQGYTLEDLEQFGGGKLFDDPEQIYIEGEIT